MSEESKIDTEKYPTVIDIYGNSLSAFRTIVMFVRLDEETRRILIECILYNQLDQIIENSKVYHEYPNKNIKLFKLKNMKEWIHNYTFNNFNTFVLKLLGEKKNKSKFVTDISTEEEYIIYQPIPFNRDRLLNILSLSVENRYNTMKMIINNSIFYPELNDLIKLDVTYMTKFSYIDRIKNKSMKKNEEQVILYKEKEENKQRVCGISSIFMLNNDGKLYSCNINSFSRLELNNNTYKLRCTKIKSTNDIKQITCGTGFTFLLTNDGSIILVEIINLIT